MHIFRLMYDRTGPRHWWPAQTSFEVIVGAVLTQFVSWRNVTTAIENMRTEGILNVDGICGVSEERLEELIRCTRFYKQKAKKLKVFCTHLKTQYSGSLDLFFGRDLYEIRRELLSLYGIGEETADSILLYAGEKPIFVVDSYTRRIFCRLGIFSEDISYGEMQKFFMDNLEHDSDLFNEFHAQIDGVGNRFCSAKTPLCEECPLAPRCLFRKG